MAKWIKLVILKCFSEMWEENVLGKIFEMSSLLVLEKGTEDRKGY